MTEPQPPLPAGPLPDSAPPAPAATRRRGPRLLLRSLLHSLLHTNVSLLLTAAVLAAVAAWLLATTSGMNTLVVLANRYAPVGIEATGGFGSLLGEFGFAGLRVKVRNTTVELTELRARLLNFDARPLRFDFANLAAATLLVDVKTDPHDHAPALDIGIPLHVTAQRVTVGRLTVAVDGKAFSLQSIDAKATAGPEGYRIEDGKVALGPHRADVAADLRAPRPFTFDARGQVMAQVHDKAVGAAVRAQGSLVEFTLDGALSGAAQGSFNAVIASFARPAVKSLSVDLAGVDPQHWHPAAPRADLAIKAQLAPDAAMNRITGQLSVVNRAPGLIDAGRIPARSATAQVELEARQLKFERVAGLLQQGSARGEFAVALADGHWQARAQLDDVDPSQLHGALHRLRIDGQLRARRTAEAILVTAELDHRGQPAAALKFDGRFTPQLATIHQASLALGEGQATAAGTVEFTGARRVDLHGSLHRFEPGRLVRGFDARLTGSLLVDGVLGPQPAGRLRFELADSHAYGRPIAGRGRVVVDAAQRFDVDVDLSVRTARLTARGGLGAPDRALEVQLDVPTLADLLPPATKAAAAGSLKASASARGDWNAPAFELQFTGKGLRHGEHRLETVEAMASYGGGSDGTLRVNAGLAAYRHAAHAAAAVQSASLDVEGTLSSHALRFEATADKSKAATVLADGGWRDDAWRGRVREATVGPPIELRLLTPAALVAGPAGVEFGPAQLAVQHVRFDDIHLRRDGSGIVTRGSFSGLQPTRFAVPVEGALTPVIAARGERPPLTLRGEWNLRQAGSSIDGRLLVERSGGDLFAGRGPESALGLVDARLDARIEANKVDAFLRVESARKGGIGAALDAWLEHSTQAGWRLAQERPWLISGALDLPTLDWINALLSDHLRASVRLGGKLAGSVRIEGTPASPTASGRLDGSGLRAAWVEQGLRLENGTLAASLQDDLIVLEELKFSGPPRVRPDDRRAAAAMKAEQEGSLAASGQLRLRDFSGVVQVAARRLPLLQQPDRWVIATGGGNVETSAKHVQVNGAFAADAGFVGLARSELPTLSSDVVVVREGESAQSRERRVTLGFDLGIDLGEAFYLRGKGLTARVEGAIRLRSAGRGAVTAVGSIEAVDGQYEGFGQKLNLARGRLNFQGPPENPGLDILALRTGLPVEVGLTITRTAADPLVRLHSDPPMAEVEALSWLVLGRAPDQGGGDNIALVQAAASLLGGGEGYPVRVAQALGVDEFSIRSGNFGIASLLPQRGVAGALRSDRSSAATVAGEIITIGKTINESLSVSYQEAISETARILQLNYRLSDRLSVVARGGTSNALDFVYTWAFD
jgi:translocation and assembly module TamB